MASDASYSYSLTTFSRSGKLLQIEYALTAVGEGKTSIGIKAKNGVVLITDKKIQNKLVDVQQVTKLEKVSPSVGAISASRRVVVFSLHSNDSCPSHEVVGGLFFEFEAIRTEPRCSAQVPRRPPAADRDVVRERHVGFQVRLAAPGG